jgi:predicted nucleotidyltransferase
MTAINPKMQAVYASAFEHPNGLIHLFEAGSALHGATADNAKSDLDIAGVFIEPEEFVYGLSKYEHFVSSTAGDNRRNTSDDVDITLYSLRRWTQLAAKGNPTALSFLWAPNAFDCYGVYPAYWWNGVKKYMAGELVCKRSVNSFRGFVTDQMKRLLGLKGQGKHGQRPELEVAHGYDTKAAMHAVRLCGEGIELMQTGHITYPRPNVDELKAVRRGDFSLDRVNSRVSSLLIELETAEQESTLPEKPNFKQLDRMLIESYKSYYRRLDSCR